MEACYSFSLIECVLHGCDVLNKRGFARPYVLSEHTLVIFILLNRWVQLVPDVIYRKVESMWLQIMHEALASANSA